MIYHTVFILWSWQSSLTFVCLWQSLITVFNQWPDTVCTITVLATVSLASWLTGVALQLQPAFIHFYSLLWSPDSFLQSTQIKIHVAVFTIRELGIVSNFCSFMNLSCKHNRFKKKKNSVSCWLRHLPATNQRLQFHWQPRDVAAASNCVFWNMNWEGGKIYIRFAFFPFNVLKYFCTVVILNGPTQSFNL